MMTAMSRVLAVDLGKVRVGLAISDPSATVAQPLDVIERDRAEAEIERIVSEESVSRVVVGIPYRMDGTSGPAALEAEGFIEGLKAALAVPVEGYDERLSTVEASRSMRAGGASSKKQRGVVDKVAATVILQAFLDSRPKK